MPALSGKIALVTGGSRGIGAATALRLAQDGATVMLTFARESSRVTAQQVVDQIVAAGGRAEARLSDNNSAEASANIVDECVNTFGGIDILVNNAAVSNYKPVGQFSLEDIEETLRVNVRAPFITSQAASIHMKDGGRIINIGSTVATRMARQTGSLYAMSKSALIGMTKGMARDLGPRNITVNMVNPGPTRTGMIPPDGTPVAETMRGFQALHDFAEPKDIASLIAYVASPESRFVTGALLSVDGGYTI